MSTPNIKQYVKTKNATVRLLPNSFYRYTYFIADLSVTRILKIIVKVKKSI